MSTIKSSAENLVLNADGANNDIKFQSNGVEKASIDQDGVITTGGASLDGAVTINDTGADVDFRVESDNDANALFVQGSDGNVGIGISTPTNPLTVEGDGARIAFSNTATYPCLGGISSFRGGTTHGNIYIETAGSSNFNTPVERIAIEGTTGEVKISTGDLFFGTAGKGIVLGSTTNTDANTLDDYEEGTWTPTASGSTGGLGYYTKIGRLVHCVGTISFAVQTNSGHATVESLPFTCTNESVGFTGTLRYTNYSAGQLMLTGNKNTSTFSLYDLVYGTGISTTSWTEASGITIQFDITYSTT